MIQDSRIKKLAKILLNYSLKLKNKERLLINCSLAGGLGLAEEIYREAIKKKAYPYLNLTDHRLTYFRLKNTNLNQLKEKPEIHLFLADWADKFVSIIAEENTYELARISPNRTILLEKNYSLVKKIILKKPWVLTYFPSSGIAQNARMSQEELENFYFKSCLQDWEKIKKKLKKLKLTLDEAQEIKIYGERTKLSLNFKGRKFAISAGEYNMPDGEIFSAPQEKSAEGEIYFNFPSIKDGKEVNDIFLKFNQGRVVAFKASKNMIFLGKILKTDKGSSFLGEFGLGVNYQIKNFIKNTLFDEKIGGTIHLALGDAYKEEEGGGKNQSAIHWDLVKDMRKKGSKIFVNGKLIFKDGRILVFE